MSGTAGSDGPKYGQRLPLNIIKEKVATDPDSEWVSIPRSSEAKDGWEKVTYAQFAKAINHAANDILALAGPPAQGEFPTIAYIGTNDSRYIPFAFGAVKAGYQVGLRST